MSVPHGPTSPPMLRYSRASASSRTWAITVVWYGCVARISPLSMVPRVRPAKLGRSDLIGLCSTTPTGCFKFSRTCESITIGNLVR